MVGEGLLRLIGKPPDVAYVQKDNYYVYPHNARFENRNEDNEIISSQTDEHGLRNEKQALSQAEIIVLGDSFVAGINTLESDTLVGRLRSRGLRVYNAGMDGYGTYQSFALLRDLMKNANPRIIVLCFYLGNDFRDNFYGSENDNNRASLPQGNPIKTSGLSKILHGIGEGLKRLMRASRLFMLINNKVVVPLQGKKDFMLSYALSEMMSYQKVYDNPMARAVEKTKWAISQISNMAKMGRANFLLLGIPSKAQVVRSFHEISAFYEDARSARFAFETIRKGYSFDRPDDVLSEFAKELGIPFISLLPVFRIQGAGELYFQLDGHWNSKGQDIAANELWKSLAPTLGPLKRD
jgi:hypothetical protein